MTTTIAGEQTYGVLVAHSDTAGDETITEHATLDDARARYDRCKRDAAGTCVQLVVLECAGPVYADDGTQIAPTHAPRLTIEEWRRQWYAVVQYGAAVFGIGSTPDEAIGDAREWLEDGTETGEIEEYRGQSLVDGRLYLMTCSEALARSVEQGSGDVEHEMIGGVLRLASEPEVRS